MVERYTPVCGVDRPCDHGTIPLVWGKCPACGHRSLGLHGQIVQCDSQECPDRLAAYKVPHLGHRHVIEVADGAWSIEHPVTCRLDGKSLHDCETHRAVAHAWRRSIEPITEVGRFYIEIDDDSPWGVTTEPVS